MVSVKVTAETFIFRGVARPLMTVRAAAWILEGIRSSNLVARDKLAHKGRAAI